MPEANYSPESDASMMAYLRSPHLSEGLQGSGMSERINSPPRFRFPVKTLHHGIGNQGPWGTQCLGGLREMPVEPRQPRRRIDS
jgi:hypothetical protein